MVAHFFDASSGKVVMAPKFRTLGQKKSSLAVDPLSIAAPPISQVPLPTPDPILALATHVGDNMGSSEALLLDKCKGKELTTSPF